MDFQKKYSNILSTVKTDIDKVINNLSKDVLLDEPLRSDILEQLHAPSKHIRPLLAFLYLKAKGYEITEEQIIYQSAIEIVHNASLMHDDVIDESTKRRDNDTLNSAFSGKIAVISGDYLLAQSLKKVLSLGNLKLVEFFCTTLENMVQGEVNQYFKKFEIPSMDDYIKKSKYKTAKLFEASISGSMLIAGDEKTGFDLAENFGIAFQIRDDLINILTTKTDIKDGVYTAPVIYSNSTDVSDYGIEKTKGLLNNYIDLALKSIDDIEENKYKSALRELIGILRYE